MPVDQPVQFDVIVILAERIDQHFGHLQPAHVEDKLQYGEERKVQVGILVLSCSRVQARHHLAAHQRRHKVRVQHQRHDLRVDQRHAHRIVADKAAQASPNVGQFHENGLDDVV